MRDINVLPTWHYHLQNADYECIYTGVTCSLHHRLREHQAQPWWGEVVHICADLYPTREQALTWEAGAIRFHRPLYNREVPPEPVIPVWITDGSWHVVRSIDMTPAEV